LASTFNPAARGNDEGNNERCLYRSFVREVIVGRALRVGKGSAKRVREIKWTARQIIGLVLLIAICAGGCIEIALWLNTHPIPE
jgi:hypothetical protein